MTTDKLKTIPAVAAISSMNSFGGSALNSDYTRHHDKQRAEHLKAIAKKHRIRDEIRERRKADK